MNKHAYLIIAHDNIAQLQLLVSVLDAPFHDIYVHFDKAKFDVNGLGKLYTIYSRIFIFSEIKVHWGSYSMVQAEFLLFREAHKVGYSYYHLLSGSDFPLKSNHDIYEFFEKQQKEFVLFSREEMTLDDYDRVDYRHVFSEKFRTGKCKLHNKIIDVSDFAIVYAQKILGVKKKRMYKEYQKGSQWVSLTNSFVEYLLEKEIKIEKYFKNTFIPDEVVIQTLIINSPWKENLYDYKRFDSPIQNMRYIDWRRGKPYIFCSSDINELMASDCMFARKFDIHIDQQILFKIIEAILNGGR